MSEAKCPYCGSTDVTATPTSGVFKCSGMHNFRLERPPPGLEPPKPVTLKPGQKEYRVITQADQWFMGKFSPARMNSLLNILASEGWRLVAVATADRATWFGSFGGTTRQEMVLFLERDVTTETVVKPYEEGIKDKV